MVRWPSLSRTKALGRASPSDEPGAMARAMAHHIGDGRVHATDRLAKAIAQTRVASKAKITSGRLAAPR